MSVGLNKLYSDLKIALEALERISMGRAFFEGTENLESDLIETAKTALISILGINETPTNL